MTPACDEAESGKACSASDAAELIIRPETGAWRAAVSSFATDTQKREFRQQLGLPTDRPVIMSGHQAQIWHPGILAKLLAMDAAARATAATPAWVVVDHDENDPLRIRAPFIDSQGRLAAAEFGPAKRDDGTPACRQPAWTPSADWSFPAGSQSAAPGVHSGLGRVRAALLRHAGAPNAAMQAAAAAFELARDLAPPPVLVPATSLAKTTLFAHLVARMREDPRACAESHNAAVRAFPSERIAPLTVDGDTVELPLWTLEPAMGSPRRKVHASHLASLPIDSLAPRALLLTGILRLAGCELFIHGLGGERYDRITEVWLENWLGQRLAPTAMTTATMRLRVPGCWPSAQSIAHASWTAHHARHDPGLLGDAGRARRKSDLIEQIRQAPRKSRERLELYRSLHTLLRESHAEHGPTLSSLDRDAAAMQVRSSEAAIASDRTWAFPLFEPEQLAALRSSIHAHFD